MGKSTTISTLFGIAMDASGLVVLSPVQVADDLGMQPPPGWHRPLYPQRGHRVLADAIGMTPVIERILNLARSRASVSCSCTEWIFPGSEK